VVTSMHERKQRMFELSDAFCALPGGLGTLDETFEMVTWRQLGLHDRPIVLLDHEGFWQPLLALIEHQAQAGYLQPADGRLFVVADSIDTLFLRLAEAPEPRRTTDSRRL
ncbi:MAG: TIGR00730 family Rossman fold protein, partial [Kiloniellales bacterium]